MIPSGWTWHRTYRRAAAGVPTFGSRERHADAASLSQEIRIAKFPVFTMGQRVQYGALGCLFIASAAYFWTWWLQPTHRGNAALYWLMTGSLFYLGTILPGMYAFFLGWMRKPQHMPARQGERVAMISLTVPGSESLEIVHRQLVAMTRVSYAHESWILVDKVHSPEIEALAASLGVRYFSRHDRGRWGDLTEHWNQPEAPFKAKTKAGNVNAWLDAIRRMGIEYDYFTQLDIDHLPQTDYLNKVLGYFAALKIAYVQAPSVYGNFQHWTSRGSAEQELVLQGPLQAGFYGFSGTPFIIGSHCTYRMSAIREIGGFQPTRAEDHLDTVVLASKGYEGVFLPEIIATGDGPETFETYIGQQFAWAFSMITVLFRFTPRLMRDYTPRQAVQFLFVQTWYTLWSIAMCMMFCLPSVALLSNASISHMGFWDFATHSLPQTGVAGIIWFWSRKWFEPRGVLLSWRGVILHIARWPIVLSALIQVILRVQKPYMITRKGVDVGKERPFPLVPFLPYFFLALISLAASWYYIIFTRRGSAQGYLFFSLEGSLMVLGTYCVVLICDIRALYTEGVSLLSGILLRRRPLTILLMLLTVCGSTGVASFSQITEALSFRETMVNHVAEETPTTADRAIAAIDTRDMGPTITTVRDSPVSSSSSELPGVGVAGAVTATPPPTGDSAAPRPSESTVRQGNASTAVASASYAVEHQDATPARQGNAPTAVASAPPQTTTADDRPVIGTIASLPVVALPTDRRFFGVYDVQDRAFEQRPLDAEHDFIPWDRPGDITRFIASARLKQRAPLVTIEPWTTASPDSRNVLLDTARGSNDATIRADARAIKAQDPQVVIVRFAHEMELTGNYPWAIANPSLYIQAYRHYVDVFRSEGVTNVRWMWSPAGNGDSPRFYPGDDYVDFVGLTVLSNKAWDLAVGATDAVPFAEMFEVKYRTVARFGKPIVIAEFGAANDSQGRQEAWLRDAEAAFARYPLLRGVVYFNAMNAPNSWTGSTPDFRVSPTLPWP